MRNILKMLAVLTFVGLASGACLVFMYRYADPLIAQNLEDETKKAIFAIFPEAKDYEEEYLGEDTVFKVKDKDGRLLGYAFSAEGNGYQGAIKLIGGIKPDLKALAGIEVLESQETPGLGQEITKDEFKGQFKDLMTLPEITYVKNQKPAKPAEIQAITGATVSSSSVVSILNEKIKALRENLK